MENKKIASIDLLKCICSLLVCLRHIGQNYVSISGGGSFVFIWTSWISPMAVPEFFIISGYLFYCRNDSKGHLGKQLRRLLQLYIKWSIAYLPIAIYYAWNGMKESGIVSCFIGYIQKGLFDGFYWHLWYIPSLMAALWLVDSCDRNIKEYYTFIIAVILFICGIIVDNYEIFLEERVYSIVELYKSIFLTTRNGLFFGFVFVFLGKILAKHQDIIRRITSAKITLLILFTIALIMQFLEAKNLKVLYGDGRANNMLFGTLFSAVILFLLFYDIECDGYRRIWGKLGNFSTVIYFTHPVVMLVVKKFLSMISAPVNVGIAIMFLCIVFTAIIYMVLADRLVFLKKMY